MEIFQRKILWRELFFALAFWLLTLLVSVGITSVFKTSEPSTTIQFNPQVAATFKAMRGLEGKKESTDFKVVLLALTEKRGTAEIKLSICNTGAHEFPNVQLYLWYERLDGNVPVRWGSATNKAITLKPKECMDVFLSANRSDGKSITHNPLGVIHVSLRPDKSFAKVDLEQADKRGLLVQGP